MLPDIKYSLPVIFVLWCVAALFVFDGLVMLAYPAMWLAVGVVFWVMDRALRGSRPTAPVPSGSEPRVAEVRQEAARSDKVGAV